MRTVILHTQVIRTVNIALILRLKKNDSFKNDKANTAERQLSEIFGTEEVQ